MRRVIVWQCVLVVYTFFMASTLFIAAAAAIYNWVDWLRLGLGLVALIPLYGLAFRKPILYRKIWVGVWAAGMVFFAYDVKIYWLPALGAGLIEPGLGVGFIVNTLHALVLYGLFLYSLRCPVLWSDARHQAMCGIEDTGTPPDCGVVG